MAGFMVRRRTAFVLAVLCSMLVMPSAASALGTISVVKGSDRFPSNALDAYASGLAGAVFEYANNPAFVGAVAFPATDATGSASVGVAPGTYYVRERAVPIGWTNIGALQSLSFDPASSTPAVSTPYVSTVLVQDLTVTNAFPNRLASDVQPPAVPGSPFINTRDNARIPAACGLKFQLVLDRSGSIFPNRAAYAAAVNAFIDTLAGTPTQIGITSFNRGANAAAAGGVAAQPPLSLTVPANVAALKNMVAQVYAFPQGGTDWDSALQDAAGRVGFTPTSF